MNFIMLIYYTNQLKITKIKNIISKENKIYKKKNQNCNVSKKIEKWSRRTHDDFTYNVVLYPGNLSLFKKINQRTRFYNFDLKGTLKYKKSPTSGSSIATHFVSASQSETIVS